MSETDTAALVKELREELDALKTLAKGEWQTRIERHAVNLATNALDALEAAAERERGLRDFVYWLFQEGVFEGREFDGCDLQDKAVECGLLVPTMMEAPCDPEACRCAEVGDFPLTCYRFGAALARAEHREV